MQVYNNQFDKLEGKITDDKRNINFNEETWIVKYINDLIDEKISDLTLKLYYEQI